MKNKPIIILIVLLTLIILGLIGLMTVVINYKGRFNINKITQRIEELQVEETYKNEFDKININSDAADIEIKQSQDEKIYLKIYSEKEHYKVENNEIELNIKIKQKKCGVFCINNKISKVELYLPENYEKEINIENNYGDIKIESFEKANLNIQEDAGDINLEKASIADIKNNYGDIKINEINKGTIKASAGDIEINKVNNIDIKNNYGDTKINEINEYVKIDADAGDVKINTLNITKNSNIEINAGDIKINQTNDIYIDAETDLGETKINNNNDKSEITLKIENNLGDIKVN